MNTETESPKKLSLVVFSGSFEKVHYALVMASSALATGREVTLFFTMEASRALLAPSGWRHLRTDAQGATATSIDLSYATRGIGTFEELLSDCAWFVKWACAHWALKIKPPAMSFRLRPAVW